MRRLTAVSAIVLAGIGVGWVWWASGAPSKSPEPVTLTVEPGTPVRQLGGRLEREGVIRNRWLFEAWLRVRGDAARIQAGTYAFPRDRPLPEIVESLLEGRTVLVSVTIPEGLRLEEVAGAAARATIAVDSAAFARLATDPALADSLLPDAFFPDAADRPGSLEGYLLPETYRVDPGTDARTMVGLMVDQFLGTFDDPWRARADSLGRSVHEIVTLASIVEEEARVAEERTVIAGVFWNRLERGMRLEADPTVQYALGGHRARVLYRDLEVDSPYNTYRYAGLPPGPIASPGRASLEATLWPDSVPYLYFVATGEGGRHAFSRTLAEHERKRREAARRRAERVAPSPTGNTAP